jgi:transcriptional regulator with XRE-family HTH domain
MFGDDKSKRYKISDKGVDRIYAEIGKRITAARKKQGISQESLAIRSDIDRSHMGFIEQGRRKPTITTLYKITRALKISLSDLFKGL